MNEPMSQQFDNKINGYLKRSLNTHLLLKMAGRHELAQAVLNYSSSHVNLMRATQRFLTKNTIDTCPICKKAVKSETDVNFISGCGRCSMCDHVEGDNRVEEKLESIK